MFLKEKIIIIIIIIKYISILKKSNENDYISRESLFYLIGN